MRFVTARQLIVLSGVLLLSGCLELGGVSPPSRFYLLTPGGETRAAATDLAPGGGPGVGLADLALGVGPIRIPAYLDRPQIVTRSGANALELAPFDRWGEPLQESVARVLATELARRLGTERVQRHPWRDAESVQVAVEVDVLRFDGPLGGPVALEARWTLRTGREAVQHASHITEAGNGGGYAEQAAAMSRALATLAREIASEVPPG
jgi:uncharacterized lipoprotein YmbA